MCSSSVGRNSLPQISICRRTDELARLFTQTTPDRTFFVVRSEMNGFNV